MGIRVPSFPGRGYIAKTLGRRPAPTHQDAMIGRPRFCPHCSGSEFRRSQSGLLRRFAALVFLKPFRCRHCEKRVWRFAASERTQAKVV
jgi:hypothetical protein